MRIARSVANLCPIDVGDHVCWVVPPEDDFHRTARAYLLDGIQSGDKIMVVGSAAPAWSDFEAPRGLLVDPLAATGGAGWNADALVALLRQEAENAGRQGFRALRVLAQMDRIWPDGSTPQQVADQELRLDAFIGASAAVVVCAYTAPVFLPDVLDQAASVHPHFTGRPAGAPAFHLFASAGGHWKVSGVVDADGAGAFHTAVTGLLQTAETLRLDCHAVELMDAAAMQMLAKAADSFPGRRILVEGANPTVRRCWELLGFNDPTVPVELAP